METGTGTTGNYEAKYNQNSSALEEDDDMAIDGDMAKLSKFTKLIAPLYLVFGLFVIICSICSIVDADGTGGWVTFMFVILASIVFSIIAALGVYKWGTVEEQIEIFKQENNKYEQEIDELRSTKEQLSTEVTKLQETTNALNRDVDNLKSTLSQYDELKESLTEICGDNQELNDLINDVNSMYTNMKNTILSNTRAGILSAYYDCALKDDEEGMSKREYQRFIARLDKKTRAIFKSFGDFDRIAGDDNLIDLNEFQQLVNKLLEQQADELLMEADDK
eukprot:CAMPEP_0201564864 /NCGR_PEP_ID=MMETSP0190_2-20130828/3513_1 /ASSEMBLY_ACC=CAM_ASM_000263 /TAXON_ID=37353 /ORGANISM="Rosalina sp." /LENGTH=277 /DNA_ID=CAMNT_0047981617 /DNA_START=27 /DNA_END=860 /DNA_ORIENTATION=+